METIHKIIITVVILFAGFSATSAQQKKQKKIEIVGNVIDARSKVGPENVFVTLMKGDSTVVDTCHTFSFSAPGWYTRAVSYYNLKMPAEAGKYIIKGEHPDYHTGYADINIKSIGRNTQFDGPVLKLKPIKKIDEDEFGLDEVVVKATKIKMVTKGDTIVYNADAFNLQEGSMLDALVRQLPGAELTSDGEIKVNGEKVEELTLNGRDFFKGNNKVMLDNLPSFTVKNIQVFHKSTEKSQWAGRDVEQKKFTMDVQLKRQYNTGILGNIEGGYGTDDRFLGRLFALRYTDCSRLSVFANMNNVNEDRKPGQNGDWDPTKQPNGQKTTRMAGVDLLIDEKEHRWRENASVTFNWDESTDESQTNAESFFSSGNTFSRSMSANESNSKSISFRNNFMLMKPLWAMSNIGGQYTETKGTGSSRSVSADASLDNWGKVQASLDSVFAATLSPELQSRIINRSANGYKNNSSYLSLYSNHYGSIKLPSGDMIDLSFNADASRIKSEGFSRQQVDYFRVSGMDIAQNKYNHQPQHSYSYSGSATYMLQLSPLYTFAPTLQYRQDYASRNSEIYRLDKMAGWGANTTHSLGELPSNRNEMLEALDLNNSYDSKTMNRVVKIGPSHQFTVENDSIQLWASIDMPIAYHNNRLSYYSSSLNTTARQQRWTFEPNMYMNLFFVKSKLHITFNANLSQSLPDLMSTIDRRNDDNPLSVQLGNPDLKSTISENAYFSINKRWEGKVNFYNGISLNWNASQRSISQGYTMDKTTGVYTFRPVNVDGNWNTSVSDHFTMDFGSGKEWHLETSPNYAFAQSVDMAAVQGEQNSGLSKVHTNTWGDNLRLDYRKGDITLGLNGNITFRHSTSDQQSFADVNATNFAYGFTGQYLIPWMKFTVATDIKMFSRRGYASSELNTNDLVWNASLSKTLLKGKLIARLEAFDILHQLRNTEIMINAQGRTETITNTIPRYAMLHLQWQFNKMPKMKR